MNEFTQPSNTDEWVSTTEQCGDLGGGGGLSGKGKLSGNINWNIIVWRNWGMYFCKRVYFRSLTSSPLVKQLINVTATYQPNVC